MTAASAPASGTTASVAPEAGVPNLLGPSFDESASLRQPGPPAPVAIRIEGVTKRFGGGPLVLDGIDLDIAAGEFVCLLGASGCGKSTLLNLIAGLDKPTAGHIDTPGAGSAVMFQESALMPWLSARRNVELALHLRGVPRRERREKALALLDTVNLADAADKRPHELSGGMRQRVALARALAQDRPVLLMDEPFAALDAMTRDDMQRLLADVWKETRKTVIYVTHNVAEAVYLADRVVVMSAHPGTVKTVMKIDLPRPRDPLSVEFLACQKELMGHLGHTTNGAAH